MRQSPGSARAAQQAFQTANGTACAASNYLAGGSQVGFSPMCAPLPTPAVSLHSETFSIHPAAAPPRAHSHRSNEDVSRSMGYRPSPRLPHAVPFLSTAIRIKRKTPWRKFLFTAMCIVQQYGKLVRMYCEIALAHKILSKQNTPLEKTNPGIVCVAPPPMTAGASH